MQARLTQAATESAMPKPTLYAIPLHRIARVRDEATARARLARKAGKRRSARIWQDIADQADDQLTGREDEARSSYLHAEPRRAS